MHLGMMNQREGEAERLVGRERVAEGDGQRPLYLPCSEDHLVPLFVALGAAEDGKATRTYHEDDIFGGVTASSWRFD